MMVDVKKEQAQLESGYISELAKSDKIAADLFKTNQQKAREYLTNFSVNAGNNTFKHWKDLGHYLLIKYIDGNIKREKDGKFEKNGYTQPKAPIQPGYPDFWRKKVSTETGDKLKVIGESH